MKKVALFKTDYEERRLLPTPAGHPQLATPRASPFLLVLCCFWGIRAPPNGPKKVLKGPQAGGLFVTMSKLENKPLTKSLGPFF
jgi:hypothetical protein